MRRVFCRIVSNAFYSHKGIFWAKFLFEICASHSRIWSDNRCGFIAQNFSVGLSNLYPKCPDHPTSEKNLLEYLSISLFFRLWAVNSQILTKTKTGLRKLPSTVSEIFKGEKLSNQKKSFPSVSDFELRISGLLVKKFGKLTKTALSVSRRDFRRKKSFKLRSFFSISLWIRADDFQDSGKKCRKYHHSCIRLVQTNILQKKVLEKKNSELSEFQGKNLKISAVKCLKENSDSATFA